MPRNMCWNPISLTTKFIVESDLSGSNRRLLEVSPSNCYLLLTVAAVSYSAQLAMQLAVSTVSSKWYCEKELTLLYIQYVYEFTYITLGKGASLGPRCSFLLRHLATLSMR